MNKRNFTFVVSIFAAAICIIVFLLIMITCGGKSNAVIDGDSKIDEVSTEETAAENISTEEITEKENEPQNIYSLTYLIQLAAKIIEPPSEKESPSMSVSHNTLNGVRVSYQTSRPISSFSSLSNRLPKMGVHVAEINPINYENPDLDVLRHMGADQYLISYLQGEKHYKNSEYDRAINEYTASLNRNSQFLEGYISRGNAYMKKRDFLRAIDDYTRAIRIDGRKAELYNYRGFARSERREMQSAIDDFSQAISINRNYVDALINRSHAYYQIGDFVKTIEDCDRIISLQPSNAVIWNRRGSAWYAREDDDKAIRDFSEAIRLRNDYAIAWYNRGNSWYNKGDLQKALSDINRCLALNSSHTGAQNVRQNIMRQMDN